MGERTRQFFDPGQGTLAFLGMWLLAVLLFTLLVWGPMLVPTWPVEMVDRADTVILMPQLRFFYWMVPWLAEKWPGPLKSYLTSDHCVFLGIMNGLMGWFLGSLIFRIKNTWLSRFIWLSFSWLVWWSAFWFFGTLLSMQLGKPTV